MPKAILVGFDPLSADRAPVRFGVAASRASGAPLIIGSVHADSTVLSRIGHGHVEEELSRDAGNPLDHVRRELQAAGVEAEFHLLGGASPPAGLHAGVEALDAGLLIVGSTTRGEFNRVLPGSTAERLLQGAPCPVGVVPGDWQPGGGLHTVGVAYRDTPEGHEALDSALALARAFDARLRILMATKPRDFGRSAGGRPGGEATSFDAAGAESEQLDRALLAEARRIEPGVDVEVDISAQDAADFLIAATQNVDVLVTGSRGYGPKRAVLLGGVSRKVIAAAHCPVIVLARGLESGLRPMLDSGSDIAART